MRLGEKAGDGANRAKGGKSMSRWRPEELLSAAESLREGVSGVALPLNTRDADAARAERQAVLNQLDDYLLPRLRDPDAPLLAVVGGSTGSGKSTLVNSLVGQSLSISGALRPTTRAPMLIHHPADESWFGPSRVLPSLTRIPAQPRTTGAGQKPSKGKTLRPAKLGLTSLNVAASLGLSTGLAILDSPDIDSFEDANRELAGQLLAAADLWVFVTTASRYADAIPWELLRGSAARGACVAVVLDRVPQAALDEVRDHLARMLRERGLASSPLFTIAEQKLDADGLLAPESVKPLKTWLVSLARNPQARRVVVRRTLTGAVESLNERTQALAIAASEQTQSHQALADAVAGSYAAARMRVSAGLSDGRLLRGEVLARWQDFIGTGELVRRVEARLGQWRGRLTSRRDRVAPTDQIGQALHSGVQALALAEVEAAAQHAIARWQQSPSGQSLVARFPELAEPTPGLEDRVDELVQHWQEGLLNLVTNQGQDRRAAARVVTFGVSGTGVLLMLVTFGLTGGRATGVEDGIAGGTSAVAQRVLQALFGDQTVRTLASQAHSDLLTRVDALLADERARFERVLDTIEHGSSSEQLTELAQAFSEAG